MSFNTGPLVSVLMTGLGLPWIGLPCLAVIGSGADGLGVLSRCCLLTPGLLLLPLWRLRPTWITSKYPSALLVILSAGLNASPSLSSEALGGPVTGLPFLRFFTFPFLGSIVPQAGQDAKQAY